MTRCSWPGAAGCEWVCARLQIPAHDGIRRMCSNRAELDDRAAQAEADRATRELWGLA